MNVERGYAWLLRAYPPRFRERYASAMLEVFRARYERARSDGCVAMFLFKSVADVVITAVLEWIAEARSWPRVSREAPHMLRESVVSDIRYALRLLVRSPAATVVAVLTLAAGIGANGAIFAIVHGVLLRPLPYAEPDRLVTVWGINEGQGATEPSAMLEGDVVDVREASTAFARFEAFQANIIPITLRDGDDGISAQAVSVTPGVFTLLGREALLGRTLREGDRFTLVLSYGFWQRQYGGDPAVVGRRVTVGSTPATIVGVMPAAFAFPYKSMLLASVSFTRAADADVWVPMTLEGRRPKDSLRLLGGVAQLKPGATIDRANDDVRAIARTLAERYPATNAGWSVRVVHAQEQAVERVRPALTLLLGGVALVLLMACVNVANLLLAQSVRRQREMAVRAALGAPRARLLRQAFTESVLLALIGAAAAWVVVRWAIHAFVALAPAEIPRLAEISPDAYVAGYTLMIALLTGIAAGAIPAIAGSRANLQRGLLDTSRGSTSGSGARLRSMLVVAEIALAVVLALGAGLLVRSFVAVLDVNPGFRSNNLLTMQVPVPRTYDTPDKRRDFYRRLFARLEAIPGIVKVGGTTRLPLGGATSTTSITLEGRDASRGAVDVGLRRAMHDYFGAMEIPVLRGRAFDVRDGPSAPTVVIINQAMAQRVFPGEDAIGKRVTLGENAGIGTATIVGIVGNVRHDGLEAPPGPEVYIHYLQNPPTGPLIVMRTNADPAVVAASVRAAAREVDPNLVLFDLRSMSELRTQSMAQRRFITLLVAVFGLVALSLAALGVYGVTALAVSERTQEMGIRVALGAEPLRLLALVVRQGLGLGAAGIAIGLAVSAGLTPMIASQLFGVGVADPVTMVAVSGVLLGVALLACIVPARRAMRVDPVIALRAE
jgi:putative ABC transport system permease protein